MTGETAHQEESIYVFIGQSPVVLTDYVWVGSTIYFNNSDEHAAPPLCLFYDFGTVSDPTRFRSITSVLSCREPMILL